MIPQDFDEMVVERCNKIKNTLTSKAAEYAFNNDRLHNFKVAGQLADTSPEQALWGMAMKHLVSVTDLINGNLENSRKIVDEKLGDMINYLILLEAVLEDTRKV